MYVLYDEVIFIQIDIDRYMQVCNSTKDMKVGKWIVSVRTSYYYTNYIL